MVRIGSRAPDFKLRGMDGKVHSLKEFRSKYLVLYFYPKDLTPGCTMQAKAYTKSLGRIKRLGGAVVGVSKDSVESHRRFRSVCSIKFPLLSDPTSRVIKKYDSYGNRGVFGWGTIRNTFVIRNGRVVKMFKKVDPRKDPMQVIDFMRSQGS